MTLIHPYPGTWDAWQDWRWVKATAGISESARFHDPCPSALTFLASRGTPVRTLMGIAGYANLATMMEIQARLDTDYDRASIDLDKTEKEAL
ncbi:MAG: hypothetical protein H0T72_06520 [Chloroflexia bacterium]|nr:hypothetical protein [Chloroflexia bacterium]